MTEEEAQQLRPGDLLRYNSEQLTSQGWVCLYRVNAGNPVTVQFGDTRIACTLCVTGGQTNLSASNTTRASAEEVAANIRWLWDVARQLQTGEAPEHRTPDILAVDGLTVEDENSMEELVGGATT